VSHPRHRVDERYVSTPRQSYLRVPPHQRHLSHLFDSLCLWHRLAIVSNFSSGYAQLQARSTEALKYLSQLPRLAAHVIQPRTRSRCALPFRRFVHHLRRSHHRFGRLGVCGSSSRD